MQKGKKIGIINYREPALVYMLNWFEIVVDLIEKMLFVVGLLQ